MTPFVHLRVEQRANVTVVHLLDRSLLNRVVLDDLHEELNRLIEELQPQHLLISFAYVVRFGTEAVNTLLQARKRVAALGGELRLCDVREGIQEIFKVLHLGRDIFPIFRSTADAIGA